MKKTSLKYIIFTPRLQVAVGVKHPAMENVPASAQRAADDAQPGYRWQMRRTAAEKFSAPLRISMSTRR